jgi:hypothetical protein
MGPPSSYKARTRLVRLPGSAMKTLRAGIASYEDIKARTSAIVRGMYRPRRDHPKVWFTSAESFARILSDRNRAVLQIIVDYAPESVGERYGGARTRAGARWRKGEPNALANRMKVIQEIGSGRQSFLWHPETRPRDGSLQRRNSTARWAITRPHTPSPETTRSAQVYGVIWDGWRRNADAGRVIE